MRIKNRTIDRIIIALAFIWLASGAQATQAAQAADSAALTTPIDLHADGVLANAGGKPLVLLFSLPQCPYCLVVRRNYLLPLTRLPRAADRPVVRELSLTDAAPLAGFHGEASSGKALAAHYDVRVAPTVLMLDLDGNLLAPPLAGGDVAGMYGAYLERALDEAQAAMHRRRPLVSSTNQNR